MAVLKDTSQYSRYYTVSSALRQLAEPLAPFASNPSPSNKFPNTFAAQPWQASHAGAHAVTVSLRRPRHFLVSPCQQSQQPHLSRQHTTVDLVCPRQNQTIHTEPLDSGLGNFGAFNQLIQSYQLQMHRPLQWRLDPSSGSC